MIPTEVAALAQQIALAAGRAEYNDDDVAKAFAMCERLQAQGYSLLKIPAQGIQSTVTFNAAPATTPGPLWMMHVLGPDDVYPAPNHETAVDWCAKLNTSMPESDVLCVAVPAIWIGTPEAHAQGLSEAVEGWTSPRQALAPTAPVEASGSEREIEPTEAMIQVGLKVDFDNEDERATIINVWQAMSALRPQPSGETREAVARLKDDADYFDHPEEGAETHRRALCWVAKDIRTVLAALRPAPVASGGQHSSGEVAGCAESEVGRAVYERIEKLIDAKPGTSEGDELSFLAFLVESVEEVGGYDGPSASISAPATPVAETAGEAVGPPREPTQQMMDALLYHSSHDTTWSDAYTMWTNAHDAWAASATPPVPDDDKLRIAVEALAKWEEFNAYRKSDPLALRFEFETEEDRLAAANALDEAFAALKSTTAQEAGEP